MPFHREGVIWVFSQRLFKMGFADIAPGANRIRHDIKLNHNSEFHNWGRAARINFPFGLRGKAGTFCTMRGCL